MRALPYLAGVVAIIITVVLGAIAIFDIIRELDDIEGID